MAIQNTLPLSVRPQIRDSLMEKLYQKDAEMAAEILSNIFDEQCRLTGQTDRSFMYLNRVHQPALAPKRLIAPPLHPELYESMNLYLMDRMRVDREEKLIVKNLFTAMMNTSDSPEDWSRMVPPALSSMVDDVVWRMSVSIMFSPRRMTDGQIEVWQNKQERALNMLKGRLALNLIF